LPNAIANRENAPPRLPSRTRLAHRPDPNSDRDVCSGGVRRGGGLCALPAGAPTPATEKPQGSWMQCASRWRRRHGQAHEEAPTNARPRSDDDSWHERGARVTSRRVRCHALGTQPSCALDPLECYTNRPYVP